jgi:hypothetical protein
LMISAFFAPATMMISTLFSLAFSPISSNIRPLERAAKAGALCIVLGVDRKTELVQEPSSFKGMQSSQLYSSHP